MLVAMASELNSGSNLRGFNGAGVAIAVVVLCWTGAEGAPPVGASLTGPAVASVASLRDGAELLPLSDAGAEALMTRLGLGIVLMPPSQWARSTIHPGAGAALIALLSRTGVALLPALDGVGDTTSGSAGELLWDSGVPDFVALDSCKLESPILSPSGKADGR
jgi:hypothetical protein